KRRTGAALAKLRIKLAQLVEANAAKLAELESLDAGKPIRDSKAIDAITAVDALEYFAGMATKIQGDTIPVPGPYVSMTLREPLGVVGGIIPWNYPLLQAVWTIVPAIAAGNSVERAQSSSMRTLRSTKRRRSRRQRSSAIKAKFARRDRACSCTKRCMTRFSKR